MYNTKMADIKSEHGIFKYEHINRVVTYMCKFDLLILFQ